ncbi:MAG: AGE family epimerase/isomerase [Verrucomicrobiae bacterium]|nr:AGE family epimerase/isomerase [Verrucomicrobiae bacterium]
MRPSWLKASLAALLVFLSADVPVRSAEVPPASHPDATELRRQAERCRNLLNRSVLNFYLPGSVDAVHGGYLEDWRDGRFVHRGERFLTLQARQLWFFATLAAGNHDRARCLEAAWAGYVFLERAFRDVRLGGYFSKTDDLGVPTDTRKHAYHNAFALYALVAYHRATRDRIVLRRAQDLFRTLDQRAHDPRHGGYIEFFHADWRPVTNPSESAYIGAIGTKTYNTHLHLLEAFAALYRVWPDAQLRVRLEELIRINTLTVQHPAYRFNLDGWTPDWRPVDSPGNHRASYGHDIECLWLTLDAVRALGLPEVPLHGWARGLAEYTLRYGYDTEHGGLFYAGEAGQPADDTRKEWWVQAEALVGLLELYRITGRPEHYQAFARTLDFIEQHQIAPDGGWWATLNENGSAHPNPSRSSMWQGAYHSGRALLLSSQILQTLQPKPN